MITKSSIDRYALWPGVLLFITGSATIAQVHVMIDPGHGGDDPGALAYVSGCFEREINLDIAHELVYCGVNPISVCSADFDGDDALDICVAVGKAESLYF